MKDSASTSTCSNGIESVHVYITSYNLGKLLLLFLWSGSMLLLRVSSSTQPKVDCSWPVVWKW